MSGDWRPWATTASVLVLVAGLALWFTVHNPMILIIGVLALITSLVERAYGAPSRRPTGARLRPTDERFVDPETGQIVTVWFDPATGERRYVADAEPK
ncbi:hypothetical protein [Sphingomonas sp.]|uniref:hypothetical protein n=1 Tax=Sphingomonas sp. TaxID=28214 RepID=UPI0025FC6E42|nr:hypothetical protein [Sphingomonas sp.]MBV9526850.1 hypothetical protein [Sphingomonas sp.]